MASSNAVVVTNQKYISEVLSSANGVLVEKRSVKSLIDGIEYLIKNKQKLTKFKTTTSKRHKKNLASKNI